MIRQQAQKHPEQIWKVMNAMNTTFPDNHFPVIIDKSLIDTLLCCPDRYVCMYATMYYVIVEYDNDIKNDYILCDNDNNNDYVLLNMTMSMTMIVLYVKV